MKKSVLLLFGLVLAFSISAQSPKAILGKWLSPDRDAKIEIFEKSNKFYGKIIWLSNPYEADGKTNRKDVKNKDTNLRYRPLINMIILSNFVYDDGKWSDGKIYDPKTGKTYSCVIKLKDGNLDVRGYVGSPMFGRSATFVKSN